MSDNSDCVVGDTVAELDLECGERGRPVEHALPFGLGFGDREVDQLAGGVLGGKCPRVLMIFRVWRCRASIELVV